MLALGYWVWGDIHRYWIGFLLGDIFVTPNTIPIRQHWAVGTGHITILTSAVRRCQQS